MIDDSVAGVAAAVVVVVIETAAVTGLSNENRAIAVFAVWSGEYAVANGESRRDAIFKLERGAAAQQRRAIAERYRGAVRRSPRPAQPEQRVVRTEYSGSSFP